jgi:predicted dithiol-disulfide oxidoreductase (DUF899 family)
MLAVVRVPAERKATEWFDNFDHPSVGELTAIPDKGDDSAWPEVDIGTGAKPGAETCRLRERRPHPLARDRQDEFALDRIGDVHAVPPGKLQLNSCRYVSRALPCNCSVATLRVYEVSAMEITRLADQSADYVAKREQLQLAEIELMRQRERVAEMRRQLPVDVAVENYAFSEGPSDLDAGDGPVRTVRLSELFTAPDRPLVIYHLMYGKKQITPCPMCTMWIDGFNGVAQHLAQSVDFAVAAAAEPSALRDHARNRGWRNLRLLSCGSSTFKYDLNSEDAEGNQDSTISVFTRASDGTIHHQYTAHPRMSAQIDQRGIDLLSPVWNVLDLTPQGRGDWYAELDYTR